MASEHQPSPKDRVETSISRDLDFARDLDFEQLLRIASASQAAQRRRPKLALCKGDEMRKADEAE